MLSAAFSLSFAPKGGRKSELLSREEVESMGIVWRGNSSNSHDLLVDPPGGYPSDFTWCNKDGVNYCTPSLNQHIPQYCGAPTARHMPRREPSTRHACTCTRSVPERVVTCHTRVRPRTRRRVRTPVTRHTRVLTCIGSCWAHGSVSALGDRIKIAREAKGTDIQLSVQHILNCGNAGSCHGGSLDGPYQWIHKLSQEGTGISYATSNPYMACSSESKEGMCPSGDWTCSALNTARTCGTFGEKCVGLTRYPNATIADYGSISGAKAMQKEIFARGPIACTIDAAPIEKYTGGIATKRSLMTDHVISVVGWGTDDTEGLYWIVRNSWGEYWGEQGYVRVKSGALALEESCAWATVADYTAPEKANFSPCYEDGSNCA